MASNRNSRNNEQECTKTDFPPTLYHYHHEHEQSSWSSVFRSIMKSVHDNFEHTKQVITGKHRQLPESGLEYKRTEDSAIGKVGEYNDFAANKAMQAKEKYTLTLTQEKARKKMQEVLKVEEDEEKKRAKSERETAADRWPLSLLLS